jgi:hypothetical protein
MKTKGGSAKFDLSNYCSMQRWEQQLAEALYSPLTLVAQGAANEFGSGMDSS